MLTCIVSLLFILGIYRSQNVNTQTILKEVSSLVDSMAETPQIKTVTDQTWVLEHPTIVKYMKTRPLPWVSKAIPADVMAVMEGLNAVRVSQDDPDLIKLIRDYYIEPPSLLPYNLTYPNREDFSKGQTPFVDSRLGHMVRYACITRLFAATLIFIPTVVPTRSDSDLMFCLQSYQGLRIDRSLVY